MLRLLLSLAIVVLSTGAAFAQQAAGQQRDLTTFFPGDGSRERGHAIVVGAFSTAADVRGACFHCHGIDGRGDAAAAFPRLTDQVYKYLYDSIKDYASGVRNNEIMSPIARALTDQQMRDVAVQDQLILWKNGKRGGDPMNIMESIAKGMSDKQIHAVSIYYASVRPADTNTARQHDLSQVPPDRRPLRTQPSVVQPPYLPAPSKPPN